jgi:hypothetical protein
MILPDWTENDVHFSDPEHRVWLRRRLLGTNGPAVFILHNPSIAGGTGVEDPTSRRGISFANAWGCSDLIFVNAATGIATDADNLVGMADPVGPLADVAIWAAAKLCSDRDGYLIAAWGLPKGRSSTQKIMKNRFFDIMDAHFDCLHVLRVTKNGFPEHPLYLPKKLKPRIWDDAVSWTGV